MLEIRRAKALALVVESASVSDSSGAAVELATLTEDGTYATPAATVDEPEAEEQSPS
jgi:trigger factor